jgi:hypothetical protein
MLQGQQSATKALSMSELVRIMVQEPESHSNKQYVLMRTYTKGGGTISTLGSQVCLPHLDQMGEIFFRGKACSQPCMS